MIGIDLEPVVSYIGDDWAALVKGKQPQVEEDEIDEEFDFRSQNQTIKISKRQENIYDF